jgi:hypothetical protein
VHRKLPAKVYCSAFGTCVMSIDGAVRARCRARSRDRHRAGGGASAGKMPAQEEAH